MLLPSAILAPLPRPTASGQAEVEHVENQDRDLVGKVLVLKMEVLPALLYLLYVYPMPAKHAKASYPLRISLPVGGQVLNCGEGPHVGFHEGGGVPHFPLKLDCIFLIEGSWWNTGGRSLQVLGLGITLWRISDGTFIKDSIRKPRSLLGKKEIL